ncbi:MULTISPECIES: hypothetical protein [Enterobacteriaceae]|uniref:Phage protein n=1 Tax=Klebsiella pneumoniae TaxID=573 RepID=A0A6M6A1E4_KLEPN|nr:MULTISPECIES: hypothetical protein [Enterobacteriaceae]HBC8619010.1 hypothetical protein [Klebsiella oxytoca]HBS3082385.1 hypothetical protein [Klebsiella variicola subsp. variicola]HDE1089338.1 hypothetical protein [Klebsiella quasipneumoniae]HDS4310859.1 hypothetical protein [Klebsiella pneumoniae subsp. pneumoniae]MBD0894971.1 hypothetical protein [Klebsiella pneumoniae]
MTDITKLAQREKFEAWWEREYKHLESSKYTDAVPHIKYGFWMAYQAGGAELVEAVEKAQGMETYWKTQCRGITDHCEELQARIAELESRTVTAAAADVLAERKRQVTTEGWTPEHDDQHVNFEMAIAGGLYAISAVDSHHKLRNSAPSAWPWDRKWWKPDGPRRDLVKAGALILAEIERLDRAAGIKVEAE